MVKGNEVRMFVMIGSKRDVLMTMEIARTVSRSCFAFSETKGTAMGGMFSDAVPVLCCVEPGVMVWANDPAPAPDMLEV
jgi:hypothetical protein